MKKFVFIVAAFLAFNLKAQEPIKPKASSSFYAGLNYSAMKSNTSLAGFAVGVQSLVKDTHLLAFELNHLVNTNLNFYTYGDKIKSETNYEITYGRVLFRVKNEIKFILQSGLRIQNLISQMKYAYSSSNASFFDEPVYIKKSFWQATLPLKLTVFRQGKHIGNSLGIYANIGKYTDVGVRFAIHLGK